MPYAGNGSWYAATTPQEKYYEQISVDPRQPGATDRMLAATATLKAAAQTAASLIPNAFNRPSKDYATPQEWAAADQAGYNAWHSLIFDATAAHNIVSPLEVNDRGGPHNPGSPGYSKEQTAAMNAATEYGRERGWITQNNSLGAGLRDAFLNPAVLAAVGGYALAPAGGAAAGESAAGSAAAETGAYNASTGLYDVASTAGPSLSAGAAEYPGAAAAGGAGGGVAAANTTGTGAGTGSGTTAGNAAAAAPAAGAPAATAATTLQAVKDYGGIALTLGGLLGGGQEAKAPDVAAVEAPPESQAAKQPDEVARRRQNPGAGQDTLLTGASGIDPFSLNLGRNKLLGQ